MVHAVSAANRAGACFRDIATHAGGTIPCGISDTGTGGTGFGRATFRGFAVATASAAFVHCAVTTAGAPGMNRFRNRITAADATGILPIFTHCRMTAGTFIGEVSAIAAAEPTERGFIACAIAGSTGNRNGGVISSVTTTGRAGGSG